MNPSFHRAIAHSEEFAQYYQSEGFTIGEMSETAQEAINCPTKKDVAFFRYSGSNESQNLQYCSASKETEPLPTHSHWNLPNEKIKTVSS